MSAEFPSVARKILRRVQFSGSTALARGQGLCYTRNYGTAANADGTRDRVVALPTSSNNRWFAGVVTQDYSAQAGGQQVEIAEPGSVVDVAVLNGTTIGVTRLACVMGGGAAGYWITQTGYIPKGRGAALALQTKAAVTDTTSVGVIGSSLDGSAVVNAAGTDVTKTALFTYAAAGDYLFVVGGGTTADMTVPVTAARYTVASKTSNDVAVVSTAMASVASSIAAYFVRGNPSCQALLDDGEQSGGIEWVTPDSATAAQHMVGGTTLIFGGATIAADSTATLANGTSIGDLKTFLLMGALTTQDYLVTVTAGEQLDGSTDLGAMEFDGADDCSCLIWYGQKWRLLGNNGTGLA